MCKVYMISEIKGETPDFFVFFHTFIDTETSTSILHPISNLIHFFYHDHGDLLASKISHF